jgi:amino acid transporter
MTKLKKESRGWLLEVWAENRESFKAIVAHSTVAVIMLGTLSLLNLGLNYILAKSNLEERSVVFKNLTDLASLVIGILFVSYTFIAIAIIITRTWQRALNELKEKEKPFFDKVSAEISNRIKSVDAK